MHRKLGLTAASVILAMGAADAGAQTKVGVVDSQRIMQGANIAKAANDRFEKLVEGKNKEAETRVKEVQELQKRLSAQQSVLSEEKIKELSRQIEEKKTALQRFGEDSKRELAALEREMLDSLSKQFQPIIEQAGKDLGFGIIMDKLRGGLVYVDNSVDITDEVLKRANAPAKP